MSGLREVCWARVSLEGTYAQSLPTGKAVIPARHIAVFVPFHINFDMRTEPWRIVLLPHYL